MKELFYVFLGGGAGSVARFMASLLWRHFSLHPRFEQSLMPWPTLVVNLIGCFLIGLFYVHGERWGMSHEVRLLLTTGFCGGLTTFSTFSYETVTLLHHGYYGTAAAYVCLSLLLGLAAVFTIIYFSENA